MFRARGPARTRRGPIPQGSGLWPAVQRPRDLWPRRSGPCERPRQWDALGADERSHEWPDERPRERSRGGPRERPDDGAVNGLTFGKGATNGLVNGNGFTNGRRGRYGPARIPSQPHWSRSVVGIAAVVALMVIVPILASLLSPSPSGPSAIIRIDGDFSDWAKFPTYSINPTVAIQNPAVNLQAIKIAAQDQELFVYARVQGQLFQSVAVNETDSMFVFLDQDNNRLTGYPIGDLGADSMVEVTGWQDYR